MLIFCLNMMLTGWQVGMKFPFNIINALDDIGNGLTAICSAQFLTFRFHRLRLCFTLLNIFAEYKFEDRADKRLDEE